MRVLTQYGKTRQQPAGQDDAISVRKNSTGSVFTRRIVNLIEGTGATLTVADDDTDDEIDVTVAAGAGGLGYALPVLAGTYNPSASTTRYFGHNTIAPLSSKLATVVYIPASGTINTAHIIGRSSGVAGTNESWSVYLRLNDTTDYLIEALASSAGSRHWSNTSLGISVTTGDYFEIKVITPAWFTTPTNLTWGGQVYVE